MSKLHGDTYLIRIDLFTKVITRNDLPSKKFNRVRIKQMTSARILETRRGVSGRDVEGLTDAELVKKCSNPAGSEFSFPDNWAWSSRIWAMVARTSSYWSASSSAATSWRRRLVTWK